MGSILLWREQSSNSVRHHEPVADFHGNRGPNHVQDYTEGGDNHCVRMEQSR